MKFFCLLLAIFPVGICGVSSSPLIEMDSLQHTRISISFGNKSLRAVTQRVSFMAGSDGMKISKPLGQQIESNDVVGTTSVINAGNGDIDILMLNVQWPKPIDTLRKMASQWEFLLKNGHRGQAQRLKSDTWDQPETPILTVKLSQDGTKGFSVAIEQLLQQKAMWLPDYGIYITLADYPVESSQYLSSLKGKRILDKVSHEPDATYDQFKKLWPDFGDPNQWKVPWQTKYLGTTGCLTVTAAAYGSLYKFAIDRWGKVRPDFASPFKFRFDPIWKGSNWEGQKIINGLPFIVTDLERKGQYCKLEQFAAPLTSFTSTVPGEVKSVMFTKATLSGKPGPIDIGFGISGATVDHDLEVKKKDSEWIVYDKASGSVWLTMSTGEDISVTIDRTQVNDSINNVVLQCNGMLPENGTKKIIIKLLSPALSEAELETLESLKYAAAKGSTMSYWESWLDKGAYFEVPEKKVNDLFRANLWHALVLPRHRIDKKGSLHIDLPYANTAYGQLNADWPVNQAVYVDYMLYGLRGYYDVAQDEFRAMFQNQQQADGRIGGFANWGVYSPSFLYSIAENYLLSRNSVRFKALLPKALKTLDWCLDQIQEANKGRKSTGLIVGPLNDLTHADREWAFTQAYFVAGLESFSEALAIYGSPRAEEVKLIAEKMKQDVIKAFSRASVQSPVVQLADGSWTNYVPTDAMTHRRIMEEWYPTDVDVGPLHLARLNAINPEGWMTTAMLNDHEDNLYFKNQGAANEPVYVPQADVYLSRDEPKAAIRAFYSLMACGFSHHQLTSLEHRWDWGQYYGPPSTDGAWFELYRKMLIDERGMDTLLICQATPRPWLEDGKRIKVLNAPTVFGPLSFEIQSRSFKGEISAHIELSDHNPPEELFIRFRHPQNKVIKVVKVNGKPWKDFDIKKEWVHIKAPSETSYNIVVQY